MAAAETLTQIQWTPEHVLQLLPSVEASPWGGLDGAREVLGNAHLFEHELVIKIIVALVAGGIGSVGTYAIKAVAIEGRLAAIEHSAGRHEQKLDLLLMRSYKAEK